MSESISELENGAQGSDSSDPASSLRAAALLTLKSKRRKPVDTAGNSGRPHPQLSDTSIQLDYGQEEVIKSSTKDVEMPPVPSLKPSNSGTEDGQMREEGEISDSEDAPSKVVSKIGLDNPVVLKAESPTHTLLDRIRDPPHPGLSLSPVSIGEVYVDPEHVRPGLSMNQDQYDTAKDIVLDLLGWGVPPDYLIECNLSREIVYYVFSELNLRLPRNLDITGLVPYTPFHVAKYSRPLTAIPTSARSEEPASFRSLHGHPSLPAKPLVGPDVILEPSPVSKSAASQPSSHRSSSPLPATSPTDEHSSATSLHDMERQRRQELLARKAVQASRKVKPVSNASSTASSYFAPGEQSESQDQDVAMIPVIATEAVDDFLKTIGEKSVTPEVVVKPEPTDSIDIDEIPGLGGPNRNAGSSFEGTGPENQTQSIYTDQVVISPSVTPTQSLPQNGPPPSSGDSGSTTLGNEQASYDDQLSHHRSFQRRGVKRPTAADFVDFDSSSQNGRTNGSLPPLKRKTASFASVSGQRKLVIDLSDSEGGEDFALHDSAEPDRFDGGSGYSSPAPGWFSATPVNTGWATPPLAGANTPAALVEKEQEIRKMRELIAQREKSRMQKVMARPSTTASFESSRPEVEEGSSPPATISLPPPANGSTTRNGAIPLDKHLITDSTVAEFASTSTSVTPPNMDSEEMADQSDVLTTMVTRGQDLAMTPPEQLFDRPSSQEPRQEPLVDVDSASSSSAQPRSPTTPVLPRHDESPRLSGVPPPRESNRYRHYEAYSSPFERYPLLRCRMSSGDSTGQSTSARTFSSSSTCNSQPSFPSSSILSASLSISSLPSFLPCSSTTYSTLPSLRPLTLATCSTLDPTKRICQYETGGGVCRDAGCEDVHLTRLGREGATDVVEPSDADTAEYLFNLLPLGVSMATIASALREARDKNDTLGYEERVERAVLGLGPRPPPPPR